MIMIMLYDEITLKLWKKMIVWLEKKNSYKQSLTMHSIKNLKELWQIEEYMKNEAMITECLAFADLYHNIIEFDAKFRDKIYREFQFTLIFDNILSNLSFLRSSYQDIEQRYHFIYLTFQKYFATKYFIRCWAFKNRTCLKVIFLRSKTLAEIRSQKFLRQEKYNERYDIF